LNPDIWYWIDLFILTLSILVMTTHISYLFVIVSINSILQICINVLRVYYLPSICVCLLFPTILNRTFKVLLHFLYAWGFVLTTTWERPAGLHLNVRLTIVLSWWIYHLFLYVRVNGLRPFNFWNLFTVVRLQWRSLWTHFRFMHWIQRRFYLILGDCLVQLRFAVCEL